MSSKYFLLSASALLLLSTSCSDPRSFQGSTPAGAAKSDDLKVEKVTPTLQIVLPNHEIRSAAELQATVVVSGAKSSKVIWTLEGPAGIDLGTIDENGLYKSPVKLADAIEVTIVAKLSEDLSVMDSDTVSVIPDNQIFVACEQGNQIFPITAEVYRLPTDTKMLPDFTMIEGDKSTTVCMDQFNVPVRNFNDGFPGVTDLTEWFALHTAGRIILPKSGKYSFRLNSDDGSIFYVDGTTIVNNDKTHSPKAVEGSAELKAGTHDFVLDYFQGPADKIALELFWKIPGTTEFVVIPPTAFTR
ncbi:MAG: hypothetical protein EOP09_15830 [Proteobacteria bacterium]|nr:MAG: hypothetical protein EOP09_15830 [Pseudomonadota bacterium]